MLKLPNSSVQVFNGLPCGTQFNDSLLDTVLPVGTLPSGTPSRKRARAACYGDEGSPSDETTSEADPEEQLAAVRVCRQSAGVQTGAPVGSVEESPAGPVGYCSSHRPMQERASPAEPTTTASGKEPGPPELAEHTNTTPKNYETRQEDRPRTMIEDKPSVSSTSIDLSTTKERG
jgi:hypothetical protein